MRTTDTENKRADSLRTISSDKKSEDAMRPTRTKAGGIMRFIRTENKREGMKPSPADNKPVAATFSQRLFSVRP